MKVYCIDNKNISLSIEVGKWYDVSSGDEISDRTSYLIVRDSQFQRISKDKFLTLEQYREMKLKKLGI
jgi:hypothetical protein